MFCSSALLTVVSSAICASATRGLSLKVTGPTAVDGASNFKVITEMTNTGDEHMKLINDPRTPLSDIPTNTFHITNANNISPDFAGARAKFVPESAIGSGRFTTLAPGESKVVEHDLSRAYDFSNSGEGAYKVQAHNLFHIINDDKLDLIYAISEGHTAQVSGPLSSASPVGHLGRRAMFRSCSANQQAQLNDAIPAAQSYASDAFDYLTTHNTSSIPEDRYTGWFGTFDLDRHDIVAGHFKNISSDSYASYTYDCTCSDKDTYAYVYPNTFGVIYLCGAFWEAPFTGTDSKAGTLIHENSHFLVNGGTQDHVYGQKAASTLAKDNAVQAINNADNHEYFAENNPKQT
ncbi:peptidyl-Lys metalloendopeptidase [Pluteus cervinus]|uniref:Peptidyl-Lys metalloendopeptidase n=1 Tax=Pluteus cervinus TaxID=181527 RepID=A0ACD3B367_9AGAR|nr:peptidyl-Lys metalloendopeptidase [Pluteus cervinus]